MAEQAAKKGFRTLLSLSVICCENRRQPPPTHSSRPLLRAGSPLCSAHVADSLARLRCAPPSIPWSDVSPGPLDPPRCTKVDYICPSSRAWSRDRAPSSGRMLGSLHNRGSPARREARACAPLTTRDPSTSVGMTESDVDPTSPALMAGGGIKDSNRNLPSAPFDTV